MKKVSLLIILLSFISLEAQTVSTDFEASQGNRSAEVCWTFTGVSLSNKNNHKPISGYSARSGTLKTNKSTYEIKSPFIQLANGNITFKTKLHRDDGTRTFNIYVDFIPYDANASDGEDLSNIISGSTYTLSTPHSSVQNVSIAVPSALANDGSAYKVFWRFESPSGNRSRRIIMDDISIPGNYVSDPSDNCKPLITIPDSDFDGLDDNNDQFPNDAARAYTVSDNGFRSIAYEDLWPSRGDYDFNDLVLAINEDKVYDASNKIKEINIQLVVRALGGDLIQGFGLHYDGLPSTSIQSISGNSLTTGGINTAANGTETGQSFATIILCDEVEAVINRTSGAFFNTVPSNPTGTADTIRVQIIFSNALNASNFDDASYFAFKDRDEEIHMKDNRPTDKADASLFGTIDDATNPSANRYYSTANGLPWAIEVSDGFDYPAEQKDIVQAYLKFGNWAQSGGGSSSNWYTRETGNRNAANIY